MLDNGFSAMGGRNREAGLLFRKWGWGEGGKKLPGKSHNGLQGPGQPQRLPREVYADRRKGARKAGQQPRAA